MNAPGGPSSSLLDEFARLAAPQWNERLRTSPPAEGDLLGAIDTLASSGRDVETTIALSDVARRLADELGAAAAAARARRVQARALATAGRFAESLVRCEEAVGRARDAGHTTEAGRALLASMHPLGEMGRLDDAVRAGEEARSLFIGRGQHDFAARADLNIGIALQRGDRPREALDRFERARPILMADAMLGASLDNSRGEVFVALNRFTEARSAYLSALEQFERAGAAAPAAIAESNLAELAMRAGEYPEALRCFEQARRRLESIGALPQLARLLAEQAEAKAELGMIDQARGDFRDALASLDRCGLPLEAARARHGLGLLLAEVGEDSEAETTLAAARAGFDDLGHVAARARVDLARARVLMKHGRLVDARRLAAHALGVLHDRPVDAATARLLLGQIALGLGEYEAARPELDLAMLAAARLDHPLLASEVLIARAAVRRATGDRAAAIDDLEGATRQVERLRGGLPASRWRRAFLGQRLAAHEQFIGALLERDLPADRARALHALEQIRGRSLLDHVAPGQGAEPPPARQEHDALPIRAEARRLRRELSSLYGRILDDEFAAGTDAAIRTWRQDIADREAALDRAESRLAATNREAGAVSNAVTADDVRMHLGEDQALIAFFVSEHGYSALGVDRAQILHFRTLGSVAEIDALLSKLDFQINLGLRRDAERPDRAARLAEQSRAVLAELHACLMAPMRAWLRPFRRVVIVPHGALHSVPWSALADGDAYVLDAHAISTVPSASLFVALAHARAEGGRPFVAGVADELAPRAEEEAEFVAARTGEEAVLFQGAHATVEACARGFPGAPLIHLACHGRYLPEIPEGCGVRMADGWLTASRISDLSLCARLVVLSACQTGRSRVDGGEELLGLLRAFLFAGAATVLASLWRVSDESTRLFMASFYDAWQNGRGTLDLASAVRQAQIAVRAAHVHPAHWASFNLTGHP